MIINQITITAEASKAYQKYCVALTAEDLQEGDIEYLKNMAIAEAVKGIDELAGHIEVKPEIKVTQQPIQQRPQYQAPRVNQPVQNQGFAPQARQQYSNAPRRASEKQINYLRSFGWNGDPNITWDQANQLLMQYKAQNGIQ